MFQCPQEDIGCWLKQRVGDDLIAPGTSIADPNMHMRGSTPATGCVHTLLPTGLFAN